MRRRYGKDPWVSPPSPWGLPLGEHPHDDFPLTKWPPLDFLGKEVLWKGDEVRLEGGMTIKGAKEQEDRT